MATDSAKIAAKMAEENQSKGNKLGLSLREMAEIIADYLDRPVESHIPVTLCTGPMQPLLHEEEPDQY